MWDSGTLTNSYKNVYQHITGVKSTLRPLWAFIPSTGTTGVCLACHFPTVPCFKREWTFVLKQKAPQTAA